MGPSRPLLSLIALLALMGAPAASGQDQAPLAPLGGDVLIEAESFGVGGLVRPGDTAGIRLRLTDRGDRVRDAVVRLRLRDPDGDSLLIQRPITLNPGRRRSLWMYAPLPPDFDRSSIMSVTVHEASESGDGVSVGRQIAAGAVAAGRVAPIVDALIAVVGRRGGGLEQYSVRDDAGVPSPTMNEPITVLTGLEPEGLPDRWMGLAAFDALVWLDGDPTTLRADQADAVTEWVHRGGRLTIALPTVGQLWTTSANPLLGAMPAMLVDRREGVDLGAYRRLLTARSAIPLPTSAVIHTFRRSPNADLDDAIPVLAGPDGQAIAMRRLIGLGSVTVLGVNPASAGLTGRIDAQVFWHRLLGHRFDVRSRTELLGTSRRSFPRPSVVRVDGGIAALINKTGSAGVGVLLGLIVFAMYFLAAGPAGFAILSRLGLRRHAWLAFVGIAALFTIIAWGGATIIKPRTTDATHLSFIDSVFGEDDARVRAWFSVLLPTYGSQTVSIAADDAAAPPDERSDLLWPWREPDSGERAPFPDRRDYTADARRPDTLRVPTRSTVKEFEARWTGPSPWRLPRPVGGVITLDENNVLTGSIVHELPAALERVVIVLNRGQTPLSRERAEGGALLANAWAWSPFGSNPWPAGEPLDLGALDYRDSDPGPTFFRSLSRSLRGFASRLDVGMLARGDRAFDAVTWFGALTPPDYERTVTATAIRRVSTHGLDLAPRLTQPCLIVVGTLRDSPLPLPLTVDGERPPSTGRTIVRWVYPLPPHPPRPAPTGL